MKSAKWFVALTVCATQPALAQYVPPKQMTLSPLGVNLVDGRFTYQATDLSAGPFNLERSYRGGPPTKIPSNFFGSNWSHNYDIYVMQGNGKRMEDSYVAIGRQTVTFSSVGTQLLSSAPESMGQTLALVNGAFVYTNRNGDVYTFNSATQVVASSYIWPRSQRVANIVYANGHRLDFTYSNSRLTKITSNYGYVINFELDGAGNVAKACVFNQAVTTVGSTCAGALATAAYSYSTINSWQALVSVQDRVGQSWGYDYSINGPSSLTCVRQVNSSSCLIQNVGGGAISQQTDANGGVWNYYIDGKDGDAPPQQPGQPPPIMGGSYIGPEGVSVSASFGAGLLNDLNDNGRLTHADWDGIMLSRLYYQEGNSVTYNYDSYYNPGGETWTPKPGSGLSSVTSVISYPAPSTTTSNECASVSRKACNKPLFKLDFNGNRTDYVWDNNSGLILSETGPADPSGIRPVKRSAYAQRYAWISNGGGYVQASAPIWVLVSEKTCRTSATSGDTCVGGAADETVTTYDYGPDAGPNNLLVRGITVTASGTTRRTCYGYDAFGNRIWETKPRAGLALCPAN